MRTAFTILLLSVIAFFSFGQNETIEEYIIKGKINNNNKPVEAATIRLLKANDSSFVNTVISDKSGEFIIKYIQPEKYLITIQSVGFQIYYSKIFEIKNNNYSYTLNAINLTSTAKLNEVIVTSKRPLIEQKIDRTVINVDASPTNTGLTALEVLEKSPGVTIDKDGNISLKGKQGVLVLVDGKPTFLSGADLATLLKNMPSTNLDQIEIMTNPPAKYDASGNSGVINLKTKKTKIKGLNGSVTVGGGIGIHPKANESFNFNYSSGKINIFGNYSYNYNHGHQDLNLTRKFRDSATDAINSTFIQFSDMNPEFQTHTYKTGIDFFANKKTTLGVVVNGYINPGTFSNINTTNIYDATSKLESQTLANNHSTEKWKNFGTNFNFRHTLDTSGTELTADLDYINYTSLSNQLFSNYFFNDLGEKMQDDETLRGNLPGNINIYSAKADFTHPLKGNAKFEAGFKSSYVKTDNNARYDNFTNSEWMSDTGRTNHFIYKENINAVYVNASKQLTKKWSAQLGLRLENTISKGYQVIKDVHFDRNYTQLFPTAYIGYTPGEKNQFALSYGRRIGRPDYGDLNPFYYFLDKYTYEVGNPYLRPQFSHNIELTHTYNEFLTTSLAYNQTDDIIEQILQQVDSTHTNFVTKSNIANLNNVSLSVNAGLPITKWWKTNIYAQAIYNHYKGFVNNGEISVSSGGYMTNITNNFQLPKGFALELSGFYRSKMFDGATLIAKPMGVINFAASKQVLKNKGTIKLNVRDFLDLQQFNGYSRYQNIDVSIHNEWDNRVVSLSFTYRFNKGQAKEHKERNSAEEEQNRVKGAKD